MRSPRRAPGASTLFAWAAAGAVVIGLAFIVGRAGTEQGVLSATASPTKPEPLDIAFGTELDPATNVAVNRTRRFRPGDAFAYSVTMPRAPATDSILVEIRRLRSGRDEVVQEPSVQGILPEPRTFAFRVRTDDLLAAWGAGEFEMRIFLAAGGEPLAEPLAVGRFTLLDSPG